MSAEHQQNRCGANAVERRYVEVGATLDWGRSAAHADCTPREGKRRASMRCTTDSPPRRVPRKHGTRAPTNPTSTYENPAAVTMPIMHRIEKTRRSRSWRKRALAA